MDNDLKVLLFYLKRPKRWFPAALEFAGVILVLSGLYMVAPIAALIGVGALFVLFAQGLGSGGSEQ